MTLLSDIAIAVSIALIIAGFGVAVWLVFTIWDAIRAAPDPFDDDNELVGDTPETRSRRAGE